MSFTFPRDSIFLIAGPCVLEDDALNLRVADHLARLAEHVPGGIVFKAHELNIVLRHREISDQMSDADPGVAGFDWP